MGSFVILFLLFCMFLQGRVQSGIMLIITLILAMGLAVLGYLLVEYAVYNGVYIKGQYLAAEYYGAAGSSAIIRFGSFSMIRYIV